ncbi:hypothetical protein NKH77_24535 [Streptomyces sp. M19]
MIQAITGCRLLRIRCWHGERHGGHPRARHQRSRLRLARRRQPVRQAAVDGRGGGAAAARRRPARRAAGHSGGRQRRPTRRPGRPADRADAPADRRRPPGPVLVYLAGQLVFDTKQQLPHLALARTTPRTARYSALPWHWLAAELGQRPAESTTVLVDLVADETAWPRLSGPGGRSRWRPD